MGRSRRAFKRGKNPVRVGVTNKKRAIAKSRASRLDTYAAHGYVANPNVLGARDRIPQAIQSVSLQTPQGDGAEIFGSEDESDELKTALNKLRKDGKKAPLQRLTKMQRVYVGRLIQAHGDNYEAMSKDMKLNKMQHPVAIIRKFCKQYEHHEKARPKSSDAIDTNSSDAMET